AALRRARAAAAVARRRAEPRRGRRDGGGARRRPRAARRTAAPALPPVPCRARRPASSLRPCGRSTRRLRAGARARDERHRARVPRAPTRRFSVRPSPYSSFGVTAEFPDFQAFRGAGRPRFANRAELECPKLLDYYGVPWDYEPRTFVLETDAEGRVTEAFRPDFYLPEQDLYLEITVMKQTLG